MSHFFIASCFGSLLISLFNFLLQIFSSKSELQLHSQLHMREVKPYKCTQCSKTFANSSYLSQHTRIHLGIKPYRCEICQRKFTQLSHLQQHVRTHTGDKPYKCRHPNCTKAFSQLSNLQSHSRCHQTDKPFKCNSCYKCFTEEQHLLEHIPKHKESKHLKTHICQYCGKSYTQETYLTKHMQKHAEKLEKSRGPLISIPRVGLDSAHYWPKVSPDTANTLVEAINQHNQQQQQQQQQQQHESCLQNNEVMSSEHLPRDMNGNTDDFVLRLSHHSVPSSTPSGSSPIHPPHEPIITVSTPGAIKTPPSSVSAFTPIQSMGIGGHHHHNHHLNHHQHPHITERGYLPYNTIAFPSSKIGSSANQFAGLGSVSNSMEMSKPSQPGGLISLHSIHNYRAHHPLVHHEHFMQGLKDKTQ